MAWVDPWCGVGGLKAQMALLEKQASETAE
jgi:hypothetical protein